MLTEPLTQADLDGGPSWFSEVELRADRWRDEHTRSLVIRDGEKIVAVGSMWTSRVHGDRYWFAVVVDRERRRQGIGRQLVGELARLRPQPLPLMTRGFVGTPELAFADALGARTIQVVPPMEVDVAHRDRLREPTPQTTSGTAVGIEMLGAAWAGAYEWTHEDWSPTAPGFAGPLLEGLEDEVDLEATSVTLDGAGSVSAMCVAFTDDKTPVLCGETTVRDAPDGERLVESCLRRSLDVMAGRGVGAIQMDGHVSDPHWLPAWIRLAPTGPWFRLLEIDPAAGGLHR
ncbi:GNAT family N-acetyltransferase [Pseudactinotalea terrae]|uniref:GNAT family N-acetyltransferase n=1 Tax=Pseudactinotalea terrae TaxID=1743262 RepID=UPI0012E13EF1|nr:GNAT family N-acetyltransferase [Pseudactinotalea terrae]